MKAKIGLLTVVGLLVFGCGEVTNEKIEETTEDVTHKEHHHAEEVQAIGLNDGEKWKVNDEMMPFIHSIEKHINAFATAEQKDYQLLAEELKNEINLLASSCTMTGESHEELHKWLLPFMEQVNELLVIESEDEAAMKFAEIQTSLTLFNQYFQ